MAKNMYQKRAERKAKALDENSNKRGLQKNVINWYPGHMAKTKRMIKEYLPLIDLVYEVIDARIPKSSKIKDMDAIIKDKPRLLIMTKTDLCDLDETLKWAKYYEQQGYEVVLIDNLNNKNLGEIVSKTMIIKDRLNLKRQQKGLNNRKIRVLIIGIPNVGKSTLINRLVGRKATNVGNKPGITKDLSWIRINNDIELLDSPGILWPKIDDEVTAYNLASMTAIKESILPINDVSVYILKMLSIYYSQKLYDRYGIDHLDDDIIVTLDDIARKRGFLLKGKEIDYERLFASIINDIKNGIITHITFDRFK